MPTKKVVLKTWGREEWLVHNELYCLKINLVNPGVWSSDGKFQHHEIKDKTFIMSEGELLVEYVHNGEIKTVKLGEFDLFRITAKTPHRFRAAGEKQTVFMEISTRHDDTDVYFHEETDYWRER